MNIIDNDLLSMQEARIIAENSKEVQKVLKTFSQEQLDEVISSIEKKLKENIKDIALQLYEEVDFGVKEDKVIKLNLLLENVIEKIKNMKCVGVISQDNNISNIGVPVGVIVAFCSESNPISTLIYKVLIAIKSGNSIIVNLQKNSKKTMIKTLDLIIKAAEEVGYPKGAISYLSRISLNGTKELLNHNGVDLILNTGVEEILPEIYKSGKTLVYGRTGNTPVFIEKTADIKKSVLDIVISKTFDNGVMPGAEQAVVVDKVILNDVIKEFELNGAYFLNEIESEKIKSLIFDSKGEFKKIYIGKDVQFLAQRVGITIPKDVKILVSKERYVSLDNPLSKEKLCPILSFYVEDDWMTACEKCIELLLNEKQGHTLVIHSKDENIIKEFSLKKPVGRVLVNTSGSFGSMGGTTELFPSMTLGCGVIGKGMTSDNVSPMNLIYIRKVGYEVKSSEALLEKYRDKKDKELEILKKLEKILRDILA